MIPKILSRAACLCALAAGMLAGCGGNDDDVTAATPTPTPTVVASPAESFAAAFGAALSQMNTTAGLTSAAFQDSFASNYLDAGVSKAQLVNGLNLDAAALAASADFSLFPMATVSNISLSNCDSQGVCTLSGTSTNSDAETLSVPFTTLVVVSNGTVRLLGDQQAG